VVDRRPPRSTSDERTTLLTALDFQRESLIANLDGLDVQAARSVSMPSGTTLFWLVEHMAQCETLWVVYRYLGAPPQADDPGARPAGTVGEAIADYRRAARRTDAVVVGSDDLDGLAVTELAFPVHLRWILSHLLEETARHAGHADILRELTDGDTGR
jgi:hypothetical protein